MARRVLKRRDALPPRLRLRPEQDLDALGLELRNLCLDVGDPDRELAAVAGVPPRDELLADELPGGAAEQQVQDDVVEAHRARLGVLEEHRGAKHARVKVLGRGEVLGEEGDGGDGAEGVDAVIFRAWSLESGNVMCGDGMRLWEWWFGVAL